MDTNHDSQFQDEYRNEVLAYTALSDNPCKNITRYHGSFIQNGTYNLLLEHVDGGNLGQLLQSLPPPSSLRELCLFWKSMIEILKGLHCLHQLARDNESYYMLQGTHQDIKPRNILLSRTDANALYEFSPKLNDFGNSHIRVTRGNEKIRAGIDRRGTQTDNGPGVQSLRERHAEGYKYDN